ncbi:MAG: 2-oxoacid:ferredoxin oxidoreductase subunit beta [Desulfohalobiaceae bacterium]|nr:2-oxoacid:ferredoxin oxidoreductase subunit beta [Desulfohalobiaceae bacterium]MCF8104286.1 2-oxoacid:ferredoxin oxidoreductase subunit beta [Desulfohalobiaceae bacterium]
MRESEHPLKKFTRAHVTRTTTCPGCGNGIVGQAILRAIDESGLDIDDFIFVSGIGCSAWIPSPLYNTDTLHTTHGRPIAYASGVKLGLPGKNVMVVSGDGDLSAIGGNHLIHAARRNINIKVILLNNGIYGMTGGQTAPTTPPGLTTITSPYGSLEPSFDIAPMVAAAGAPYAARWTTYQPRQIVRVIKKMLQMERFGFLEAVTQCPVQYGRASKLGSAVDMLKYYKENSVKIQKAREMDKEQLKGKIVVGEFVDMDLPDFSSQWKELQDSVMEAG